MNVVLLTNILTPYRQFFYDKLYEQLNAQGNRFTVLVMAKTEPNRAWQYEDYQRKYTRLLPHKSIVFAGLYLHFNTNLQAVLAELQPNLVIAAGGYLMPAVLEAIYLKSRINYKLLFWSESYLGEKRDYGRLKLAVREAIRKLVYPRFDGFWYAGRLSAEFIQTYAKPEAALFFVPNLVDNRVFTAAVSLPPDDRAAQRAAMKIGEERFVFVCPARLAPVKGLHTFIELLDKCGNKEQATVLIPGDGELRPELERRIAERGLDIRLLGYKTQQEVAALYAVADSFLMPSLSDPNPLTCVEALWSGLPLFVSTHVGNYPEVVRVAENGYVFDYARPAEASAMLDALIASDRAWQQRARQVSLQIAQARYEPDCVVQRLIEQLKAYVGRAAP